MKSKKVCILTSVHIAFDIRIFYKEAKSLAEKYNVTIIAPHDKSEKVDGVQIIALPKKRNRIHRMFGLTFKTLQLALKQKADIYHFHDPELLLVGVLLKLLTRKKIIYDVHEDYSKQILSKPYIPIIARKSIALFVKAIEFFSLKFFDGILTATDDILLNFSHHKRANVIRNFPDITNLPIVKKSNKNNGTFNIIYAGNITEIRGITQVVRALEFFDSNIRIKLTLCGRFIPAEYEVKLRNLKGFEKVNYSGLIELYAVMELLGMSNAGIVCFLPNPNHIKAMPNKIFEYMAVGLPVIASNFPLWKELVEDNHCGMCVDPMDPAEIAEAIKWIINNPEEAKRMGDNGRKFVKEKYNWKIEEKKLISFYEELVS